MSLIMAHRGARNLWAENSLLGFRETVKLEFDGIEFDVHRTDSGELIVIHDATLERTTNGSGPVRAVTPEGRRALRLKGPDGALIDEGIPSLAEVLDVLQPGRADLYVEIKADAAGVTDPRTVGEVAALLRARGLEKRAVLHSFDIAVVRQIRDEAPEFRRLISVNHDWAERQGGLAAFLTEVADLVDIIGIHHELFDREAALVRNMGLWSRCSVWTINTPELIRDWIARQPGYLVSDDPVLVRQLRDEVAQA